MPIIANNITDVRIKIDTKEGGQLQGIQISPSIMSIEEKKVNKEDMLLINCSLLANYNKADGKPLAQFMVSEEILMSGDAKEIKEIVGSWEKDKKLPSRMEEQLLESMTTVCMYDLQFFTNKMRFPPAMGFKIPSMKTEKKSKK